MIPKKTLKNQGSLFFFLEDTLNQKHPLYILSNTVSSIKIMRSEFK
jgi:IS5 family transposase